ncbi:symmetrical bis(5'-nucleosyl)-tetraphosphatase [methane-oxidizing endosymbiont of Gigantopelta aegis]|uniref:symmetrical bis(5'-nucleosyl)-tetraphosphatase n=1 Tax=methane-oxidizing endosymbiont of Gigantopelta aegis TaxID=2794938 RepID=UPI0018DE0287|nr:symmetrical bis(5'-nucleosyl)-tetraphosphatase [methane-oxidizing endosymbiont of Gigantopelta aegis]
MSIYAIGDIQGCYDSLRRLLDKIAFDPGHDQLWFAGDLVNRGPKSLETLRFIKSLGDAAICVLGNHDLHLIATAVNQRKLKAKDSLGPVLAAPDCDELIHWLRHRPLLHRDKGFNLLHAGLAPQWSIKQAEKLARQVERILQGKHYADFFKHMYGDKPDIWSEDLSPFNRTRFVVNCFTRMRYCDASGRLDFHYNGPPGSQPDHLMPWFMVPDRKTQKDTIIFGHWSTLGFYHGYNCYAIDTGCLWGGELTAIKLGKTIKKYSIRCKQS